MDLDTWSDRFTYCSSFRNQILVKFQSSKGSNYCEDYINTGTTENFTNQEVFDKVTLMCFVVGRIWWIIQLLWFPWVGGEVSVGYSHMRIKYSVG